MLMMRRTSPRGVKTITTKRASIRPTVMKRSSSEFWRTSLLRKVHAGKNLASVCKVQAAFDQGFLSFGVVELDFHEIYCTPSK